LGIKILSAVGGLSRQRWAIIGGTAAKDVHDINVLATKFHGVLDYIGKLLASAAHERFAPAVFVGARGLTDEDQRGIRIADAENRLSAVFHQHRTARTCGHAL